MNRNKNHDSLCDTGQFRALREDAIGRARSLPGRKAAISARAARRRSAESARLMRPRRLVIVDDDPNTLRTLVRVFEGHEIRAAANAREALALVAAWAEFDALITDQKMPGASGLELVESIRAFGFSQPIVMVSGFSGPEGEDLATRALAAGVDEFVRKPYEVGKLVALVLDLTR